MKTITDYYQFFKWERKTIRMKFFWRKEYRQTIALMPPKTRLL